MVNAKNVNTARTLLWGAALSLIIGCQAAPKDADNANPSNVPENLTACPDQQAEVCTQQYDPVCGYLQPSPRDDGQSSSQEWATNSGQGTGQWRTFGNACSACTQEQVMGYQKGSCEEGR